MHLQLRRKAEMSEKSEAHLLDDFGGLIKLYSDGSVVRGDESSLFSLLTEPNNYNHVEYKDVVLDEEVGLWVRLYLPPETTSKALVVMYYHGGGFILFSPATPFIHHKCQMWAATLGVLIASVNYRMAPEHRLPCAYDDSIKALHWLQLQALAAEGAEPWLHSHADFSRVFIAGESAGGNIAHHVGVWARKAKAEMEIKGLILLYPFFGCEERTASEKENSPEFSLEMSDTMWRLALPVGSNRDHPFSNLLIEGAAASALALPAILFVIAGHDILRDQQLRYCGLLEKCGKQIRVHVCEEEEHGFLLVKMEEPSSVEALRVISDFIK
ncbi:hypothetical protein SUGI_0987080 [Cryptomeria japonica]|uniref:probable carboxylesterase 15 n=1 Tax=Cryptomeria japonica TaxID=3369 RepID=UPI0024146F8A|nr:probable carboxylesterase 15 [Cryptomeria japonica]GLJ46806.1 hypothetical protein SUGI_0987080 [Cryptomeria japonica]